MIDLFKISFNAHYKYLSGHIFTTKDKVSFAKSYSNVNYILSYISDDLSVLRKEVKKYSKYPGSQYYKRGFELAIEIIDSLERRFE